MAYDIIVSGHLCADLLPDTPNLSLSALGTPGKLYEIDALEIATGGSVSNTGLALHRLGVNVGLMTTVGDDLLGRVIIAKLKDRDEQLGEMIAVRDNEASSYSILLSPQNADRIILHCTGNNARFDVADIDFAVVQHAKIFHLGYPPLLPMLYANDAQSMVEIFRRIQSMGVLTSLDMAHPDPSGTSGSINWRRFLERTLPHVDIFLPSIEELVFMLRREDYDAWHGQILSHLSRRYVRGLADDLLAMGSPIVGFKMGAMGFYLRTANADKLSRIEALQLDLTQWANIDEWHPAFEVTVVGTTGAGDCAYGGFLAALLRGLAPQVAMQLTCAVGACNVEAHDANSSILSWDQTQARIKAGWATQKLTWASF